MKIGFFTDPHVGNHAKYGDGAIVNGMNVRCRDVVATIAAAAQIAKNLGCSEIGVAGDVFDYDRVEPAVERAVQSVIEASQMAWTLLVGNHDQTSGDANHNALSPLRGVPGVTVDEKPTRHLGPQHTLFSVPFRSGRAEDWLESAMLEAGVASAGGIATMRIMMLHLGISDSETPYYLDGANDSVSIGTLRKLVEKYDIHHVFAGNWHCQRRWQIPSQRMRTITQIGTLVPPRFSDSGLLGFGGLAVLDTVQDTVTMYEVPGPRWLRLDLEQLENLFLEIETQPAKYQACKPLYVSAQVGADDQEMARDILGMLIKRGYVRAGEVGVQAALARQQAVNTIRAVTQQSATLGVVTSYLDNAPIPPSVVRAEVREFVLDCLKGVM